MVDDDAFLRDMYATKFTESGHKVKVAENGEVGLSQMEENSFDVVLLDMVMPGMNGLEFLRAVQALPKAKETKFIVLTNQGEESDKAEAKQAGAVGYIVKAESIPSDVVKKVEDMF